MAEEGFSPRTWLNKKIANLLGDLKDEREPEEDPSPSRGVCRIVFVVLMLAGFVAVIIYHVQGSPDVSIKQINQLREGKNREAAFRCLYENNVSCPWSTPSVTSNSEYRNPAVCPCNSTSVRWKDFLSFYVVYENSPEWITTWSVVQNSLGVVTDAVISIPDVFTDADFTSSPLEGHVVKDTNNLTSEMFCDVAYLWPVIDNATENDFHIKNYKSICLWMAAALLPGAEEYQDLTTSGQSLESPFLLNRELLNMNVADRAREAILRRQQRAENLFSPSDIPLHEYYSGITDMFTGILGRDDIDIDDLWLSYAYGAIDLIGTWDSMKAYSDPGQTPLLFSLHSDANGPPGNTLIFLHREINWTQYYDACDPLYCEVTKSMSRFQKVIWAFGLLGGVITIVLAIVSQFLWPATAFLLRTYHKRSAASVSAPEHPRRPILMTTTLGGKLAPMPQSHQPEGP